MSAATAGALVASIGLAGLLLPLRHELRLAGFGLWAVGCAIMAVELLGDAASTLADRLWAHPALAVLGLVAAIAALAAAVFVLLRWPWSLAVAAILAAPARIPLHIGGQEANLLVPLYAVILAAAIAAGIQLVRRRDPPPGLDALGPALAAMVGISALSLLWDVKTAQGEIAMLFFYLPFAFLALRISQLHVLSGGLRACFIALVSLALLFAGVAFYQRAAHDIWWNSAIEVSNAYRAFFRVNSLFYDASVYGRYMAVTVVLMAGVLLVRRTTVPLLATMAVVLAGLYLSYSQSSWLALAAGVLVLGASVWPRSVTFAVLAVAVVAGSGAFAVLLHDTSAQRVTNDRSSLVRMGWDVIRDHPLGGAGLGGFRHAAAAGTQHPFRQRGGVSHTTPVTVAAELGPLGLAAYIWLLVALVAIALQRGRAPRLRLAVLAGLTAIFVSSLFYDSFFEDPATWILMGLLPLVGRGLDEPGT
jgi:putative inorganic carbon (hco3(-)) transporter